MTMKKKRQQLARELRAEWKRVGSKLSFSDSQKLAKQGVDSELGRRCGAQWKYYGCPCCGMSTAFVNDTRLELPWDARHGVW